ncbi:putative major facilitator superfamily MFS-1 [Rosellinia necatrix]|uniref:Putative major facilitator superfamily MFS-1 n=1 Tax=Rosellinia necatrix TaxID=77044 RepID=A0A1W2TKB4_ROSNE|nr:putative major facilitator superfamily MFS-1 [Rosellinia necatrix]
MFKTYVVAPNFSIPPAPEVQGSAAITPQGQLQLGDILNRPFGAKLIAINRYDRTPIDGDYLEDVDMKGEVEQNSQNLFSGRLGVWASLLANLGIGLDVDLNIHSLSNSADVIKIKSLETRSFDVRDDYVKKVLMSQSVADYISEFKSSAQGAKEVPLYMVSGLKVAKGASSKFTELSKAGANIGASGSTGNADAKLLEVLWKRYRRVSFETSTDFVLAFQLTHIRYNIATEKTAWDVSLEKVTLADGTAMPPGISVKYAGMNQDFSGARKPYQEIFHSGDDTELLLIPDLE